MIMIVNDRITKYNNISSKDCTKNWSREIPIMILC